MLLGDEIGQASPPLLAGCSRRASYGRKEFLKLDLRRVLEQPFGLVLLIVLMGDFMQLNPVANHTLIEAFLRKSVVPGAPKKTTDEDSDGYKIFRKICENVVLFTGTHRFQDKDLPRLLEIMRTEGGAAVPEDLRAKIRAQVQAGPRDPRLAASYTQEGVPGFFAHGAKVAIQWEQVARMQQLHVIEAAKACPGPAALVNTPDGEPDLSRPGFGVADSSRAGQLVYYFQAVDRFKHAQERQVYIAALKFVNLSKSAGLMGMLGLFLGMRVRLTKKIKAPELVQEATGEIVGIVFHPRERFGHPSSTSKRPAEGHECWGRGWVRCDYLLLRVEVRFAS